MEYQLNWFGAWHRRRRGSGPSIQLIYVLDDPSQLQECIELARRCQLLYTVPFELVINKNNLGYAGANNCGVEFARAETLLLLNSDILPSSDECLTDMLSALHEQNGRIGALGARLLFDNDAVQHQGMEFMQNSSLDGDLAELWLNDHPGKGMKASLTAAEMRPLEEVEAATAACLMLPTRLFRTLGGFSLDYILGDFEDSDLCLRIREFGLAIAVDHSSVFYHLERQSLSMHNHIAGIKMKLVTANAHTHHENWCSTIERLKQSEIRA